MKDRSVEAKRYKQSDGWEDVKFDDTHKNERRMAKIMASLFYYYDFNNTL